MDYAYVAVEALHNILGNYAPSRSVKSLIHSGNIAHCRLVQGVQFLVAKIQHIRVHTRLHRLVRNGRHAASRTLGAVYSPAVYRLQRDIMAGLGQRRCIVHIEEHARAIKRIGRAIVEVDIHLLIAYHYIRADTGAEHLGMLLIVKGQCRAAELRVIRLTLMDIQADGITSVIREEIVVPRHAHIMSRLGQLRLERRNGPALRIRYCHTARGLFHLIVRIGQVHLHKPHYQRLVVIHQLRVSDTGADVIHRQRVAHAPVILQFGSLCLGTHHRRQRRCRHHCGHNSAAQRCLHLHIFKSYKSFLGCSTII